MENLKNEVVEILASSPEKTLLYGELYDKIQSRNIQALPNAIAELKAEGKVKKQIRFLPENKTYENRVWLIAQGGE